MDEFLEKFWGGVIFNPKIYIADFGPLYRAFTRVFGKYVKYTNYAECAEYAEYAEYAEHAEYTEYFFQKTV